MKKNKYQIFFLQFLIAMVFVFLTLFVQSRTAASPKIYEGSQYVQQWGTPFPFVIDYLGLTEAIGGKPTLYDDIVPLNFLIDLIFFYIFIEGLKSIYLCKKKHTK
ncbi:MAG: hypothetical protein ABII02_03365 [Candidatus Magasanikbacteria bacterium]